MHVYYGAIHALKGVSLRVKGRDRDADRRERRRASRRPCAPINGLNRPRQGTIRFEGRDITNAPPHAIVKGGIAQSPEGRRLFPHMTVTENLEMGAFQRTDRENFKEDMDRVFELFPRLHERRRRRPGRCRAASSRCARSGAR